MAHWNAIKLLIIRNPKSLLLKFVDIFKMRRLDYLVKFNIRTLLSLTEQNTWFIWRLVECCNKLTGYGFKLQNLINIQEIRMNWSLLWNRCLFPALKLLRKAKLAPGMSVARTAESCSKRQKLLKNRDRPTPQSLKMYTPSLQLLDQLFENSHLQGSLWYFTRPWEQSNRLPSRGNGWFKSFV